MAEDSPDPAAFDQVIPLFASTRAQGVCEADELVLDCVLDAQRHYLRAFGEAPADLESNALRLDQRINDELPIGADRLLAVNEHLLEVGRRTPALQVVNGLSCQNCHGTVGTIP